MAQQHPKDMGTLRPHSPVTRGREDTGTRRRAESARIKRNQVVKKRKKSISITGGLVLVAAAAGSSKVRSPHTAWGIISAQGCRFQLLFVPISPPPPPSFFFKSLSQISAELMKLCDPINVNCLNFFSPLPSSFFHLSPPRRFLLHL